MILGGPTLRRAANRVIAALTVAVVTIFAVMMTLVFLQVVDRFLPTFSWFWTEEVVRTLLVWTVMLGLPVVLYHHEEILVDILNLPSSATIWRMRLAAVLSIVFLAILAWQGLEFTSRSVGFNSPTLGISRGWIYAPIPLGAFLGCIALLIRAESRAQGWPQPGDFPANREEP